MCSHVKLKVPLPLFERGDDNKRRCSSCLENTGLRLLLVIVLRKKKKKKINTPEREQKNKPLKRLMNFKSASH